MKKSILIPCLALACIFGGAMLGMHLRDTLPDHQLSPETKDSVRLGMGLVATMTALLLGLLVASAKGSYDAQRQEVIHLAGRLDFLGREACRADASPALPLQRCMLRRDME